MLVYLSLKRQMKQLFGYFIPKDTGYFRNTGIQFNCAFLMKFKVDRQKVITVIVAY